MISSGGLTNRLLRLERAGLVNRRPSQSDARSLLVELTSKGRDLAERAFREDMAVEAQLLDGLSDKERAELTKLLARLVSIVEGQAANLAK